MTWLQCGLNDVISILVTWKYWLLASQPASTMPARKRISWRTGLVAMAQPAMTAISSDLISLTHHQWPMAILAMYQWPDWPWLSMTSIGCGRMCGLYGQRHQALNDVASQLLCQSLCGPNQCGVTYYCHTFISINGQYQPEKLLAILMILQLKINVLYWLAIVSIWYCGQWRINGPM